MFQITSQNALHIEMHESCSCSGYWKTER